MPTPDRTTIKAAVEALVTALRTNLSADPPTAVKPFRRVEVGVGGFEDHPRPFLTVFLNRARPIGVTENDKLTEVSVSLRMVTDVLAADPHAELLDKSAAVDDYLDGILDTGILDGAAGFDERVWTYDEPRPTVGARVASATATQTLIVKVQRNFNRVPA